MKGKVVVAVVLLVVFNASLAIASSGTLYVTSTISVFGETLVADETTAYLVS